MKKNTTNNVTVNNNTNTMSKEDNTMKNQNNNTQATTNNNTKEVKNMKKRIGFVGNMVIAGVLTASKGTGYGLGYAKETVKEEACYYGRKIKTAVAGTKVAQNFVDGYYSGVNDAYEAYANRAVKRDERAHEKAMNKAARQAADELMDECDWGLDVELAMC